MERDDRPADLQFADSFEGGTDFPDYEPAPSPVRYETPRISMEFSLIASAETDGGPEASERHDAIRRAFTIALPLVLAASGARAENAAPVPTPADGAPGNGAATGPAAQAACWADRQAIADDASLAPAVALDEHDHEHGTDAMQGIPPCVSQLLRLTGAAAGLDPKDESLLRAWAGIGDPPVQGHGQGGGSAQFDGKPENAEGDEKPGNDVVGSSTSPSMLDSAMQALRSVFSGINSSDDADCPVNALSNFARHTGSRPLSTSAADGTSSDTSTTGPSGTSTTSSLTGIAAWTDAWRSAASSLACVNCRGLTGAGSDALFATVGNLTSDVVAPSAVNATASNRIVEENLKPGTPESVWGIDGAGDSNIEGFATEFSIDNGDTVSFKINTDSTHYRIDIYRVGYYQGNGAHLVDSIDVNLTSAQVQPVPLFDDTLNLVDAGNWSVSASWDVPADAVSGVYFAKLTRLDGVSGENHIPFVVRDDENPSDITFQTSDTTWQAYNWWGGYNVYFGPGGRDDRAYAVSYNRPIVTRDPALASGPQDYLWSVEYPAIRWLEQNGFDVNYISGIDTDRYGSQLLNSSIFLSVGHDEYWSGAQRTNVEAARDAGVNLAFWSGNEVYWRVRWETSIDGSGTPYRTMVVYKETWANGDIDPSNEWTGTWRDGRFVSSTAQGGGNPENGLTGTIFTVDSYRLDQIEIPYEFSTFRFWDNTSIANLQPGQVGTLVDNLLGYEWDSDLDNGFRPAGLVPLSSTTVNVNTLLLDEGNVVGPGVSSHALTLYRDIESGALVFGAGTVYWAWGLDSHHDLEATPTDPNVQQAMINLFAEMGVFPATLMAGLVSGIQSTDTTAPTSAVTPLTATYQAGTTINITGTATDTGGGVVAVVEVSTDGVSWHRATGRETWSYSWTPDTAGSYTIRVRAVDDSINMQATPTTSTVTVSSSPYVSLFPGTATPDLPSNNDGTPLELGVKFTASVAGSIAGIKFYRSPSDTGTDIVHLWSSTGTSLGTATYTGSGSGWQSVLFSNPVNITAGTTYVASYHSTGGYAATNNYFTSTYTNGVLSAPSTNNGVYAYSATATFPSASWNNSNYWVDVLFAPSSGGTNQPPVANADSFSTTAGTALVLAASQLLANDTDANGDTLSITGVTSGAGGTAVYNSQANTVTFTPTSGFTGAAAFTYAISDGNGGTANGNVGVTVNASGTNQPPVANADSFTTTAGTALVLTASQLLANDTDANGHTLAITGVTSGSGGTAVYNSQANTVTFTPTSGFTGAAAFTYAISDGNGGTANGNVGVTVNASGTTYSLFSNSDTPALPSNNDGTPLELGVKFTASVAGTVSAIKFYRSPSDTGTDIVNLWTSTGTNLGTATYTGSGSGWQTVTFASPVSITAGTTYVASYHTTGGYAATSNYFTSTYTSGVLSATSTNNGVYAYSATSAFPTSSWNNSNYWVDVVFTSSAGGANQPPVANADSFTTTAGTALVLTASQLLANDTDANGNTLSITGVTSGSGGTAVYNSQANTVTFTPTSGFTGAAAFTYAISDGNGGTANGNVAVAVNASGGTTYSLFSNSETPALPANNDGAQLTLGVKFTSSIAGTITAIEFYRSSSDTGQNVLDLWTSTGTRLATTTFTNTSASGWQTVTLPTPVQIQANTTYVASYHTTGGYAATNNYFTNSVTNGVLTAPSTSTANGNGVYAYGGNATTSLFPSDSWNASNYWVDVVLAA